jgi:hypothetical protein
MAGIRISADMRAALASIQRIQSQLLSSALTGAAQVVMQDAQQYPAPPAGSQYVRTYVLREGWQYSEPRVGPDTVETDVYNDTPYAPYVVGDEQAAVHAGRWRTVSQIAADNEDVVADMVEAAVDRIVGSQ